MRLRVTIEWTETARRGLKRLPPNVRKGIIQKIEELVESDPRQVNKPLVGPLQGYYRVVYSRYRAIYSAEEKALRGGDARLVIRIIVVAVGLRKERDQKDIDKLATKLAALGILKPKEGDDADA